MSDYSLYCTEEQTKKALELGAPIQYASIKDIGLERYVYVGDKWYTFPTTEQMIGWLEDGKIKKIRIDSLSYEDHEEWFYSIFDMENNNISFNRNYNSRKEATLAAIDAALDYLTNNKK